MTTPRFAGLGGVLRGQARAPALDASAPAAPEPDAEDELTDCEPEDEAEDEPEAGDGTKKKDSEMTDTPKKPDTNPGNSATAAEASADNTASIRAEERGRMAAVFAHDNVKGREAAAAALLAESDMSADKIIALLPSLTQAASDDGGKDMLAAMREGASVDTGSDDGSTSLAEENHGWGKIHEEIRATRA